MTLAPDDTHDPSLRSWVESANDHSDFPIQNLAFGIVSPFGGSARVGVAIGNNILDLAQIADRLPEAARAPASHDTLNALLALPSAERIALRRRLSQLLSDGREQETVSRALLNTADCMLHLPMTIGDYTDFYVGIHHATNVGKLFRPDNPLLENYKYLPIGYHGRASSVRPSGAAVRRPTGQYRPAGGTTPLFGPSTRLDFELELGVWIGSGNDPADPITIDNAPSHIAGLCLLNDWSARDIQSWEYQPLGPFLAKSFHTTISPWVVTTEALAPFRIAQPARPCGDPEPLAHLSSAVDQSSGALAIELEVWMESAQMREFGLASTLLSRSWASNMYWTIAQMVTHHASNGCNLRGGDLLGTGTISGTDAGALGSLLEMTNGGLTPLTLPTGETRTFLEDGDAITLRATARAPGFVPIGFGACQAIILPTGS